MGVFDTASDLQWGTRSAFKGAEASRLYADRWGATNHPDTEIQYALGTLRASSRHLVRNNPYAAGAVESIADNLIGWEGIRAKPVVRDRAGEPDRLVNWELERAWAEWGDQYATADGVESWFETERLIAKTWAMDGEVFLRHRRGWDNPHGYAAELLDADLLDATHNASLSDGREIVMGVEVDRYGRPLAYWFWREHPDSLGFRRDRERVPADQIAHHFIRYRPGQTRGFPLFTPALTNFEMADGYTEAELVAMRYHASKMFAIKNTSPDAIQAHAARLALQAQQGKGDVVRRHRMAPGVGWELDPGQEIQSIDMNHPNDAFTAFLDVIYRGLARTASMSHLTFTGDLTKANYSSMRAGLLPERDHWRVLQNITARRIHGPVRRNWLPMALLTGALDLRSARAAEYQPVEWRGRRWQWVDPSNDLEAAEREVKLGVNSRQRLAADRGLDFEVVVDESQEDLAYAKQAGVYVGGVDTPPPSRTNGKPASNGEGKPADRLAPFGV